MKVTKRQLRRIIKESWYEHDQREEDERMAPPHGSHPPHWTQGQMDAWETGFDDAMIGELPDMRPEHNMEYRAGYEAGLEDQGK